MQSFSSPPSNEISIERNNNSATITFVNPAYKPKDQHYSTAHDTGRKQTLANIQAKIHPGIPADSFIHSFTESPNQEAMTEQLGYTEFDSAFGSMVHDAFGKHKGLEIRPDDLHLLIVQGLTRFLQQYSEDFRQDVVPFQGKQKISVYIPDISNKTYWEHLPHGFATIIKKLITSPEIANAVLQDYSDSNDVDRNIKAITLMGAFSSYFNYEGVTLCFIPQFILKGTEEDWAKLVALPQKLMQHLNLNNPEASSVPGKLFMRRWLERLQPVLQQFYAARLGEKNPEFWLDFYKFHNISGGDRATGNMVYFYPFLKSNEYQKRGDTGEHLIINEYILGDTVTLGQGESYKLKGPATDHLPANYVSVDLNLKKIDAFSNTVDFYAMGIKGGIIAYSENPQNHALRSHADFSIFYKGKVPANSRPATVEEIADVKNMLNVSSLSEQNAKNNASDKTAKQDMEVDNVVPTVTTPSAVQTKQPANAAFFQKANLPKIKFEFELDADEPEQSNSMKI